MISYCLNTNIIKLNKLSQLNYLNNEFKGTAYVVLSGILYGFLSYFGISLLQNGFSIASMLFWRFLFSSIFLFIIQIPSFKEVKLPSLKTFFMAMIVGSSFYSSSTAFFFMACKYICSGLAMVIFFVYPALVAIINWILYKTKITKVYFSSFVLITFGIILLIDLTELEVNIYGILLALLSGLTYAFYLVLSKKQLLNLSPLRGSLMVSLGSSLIFLVLMLIESKGINIPSDKTAFIYCIVNGLIATALPMVLMLLGLQYINSTKASILSVLEPVFTVIFGWLLLNEILSWQQIAGIIIVLAGSLIICKNDTSK